MKIEIGQGELTVGFQLASEGEQQAFLVIREPATRAVRTLPMRSRGNGQWEQAVELRAGTYHARYYAGDTAASFTAALPMPPIPKSW